MTDLLPMLRRLFPALVLLLQVAAGLTAASTPVRAHASLTGAVPADGSMVPSPPTAFALTFSEPTSPLLLRLITPDGKSLPLDRFTLRDRTLDIVAPDALGSGTYVLSWRVVSEDGHPVGGSVVFSIGAASGAAPLVADATEPGLQAAIWTNRLLLYGGLFVGIGGAFFLAWLGAPARDGAAVISVALAIGTGAALLSIGLQGLDALGAPLGALGQPIVWQTGFATSLGKSVLASLLAIALAGASLALPTLPARVLTVLALIGLGSALAASGHAGTAPPQWLTRPSVFLHAVGIALWVGALAPLGLQIARRSPNAAATLRRFARFIPLAVLPLVASGLLLALIQLENLRALWSTAYGQVLSAKLVLVALLFALAAYNRLRLTEPARQGEARATRRLLGSIRLEIVLVLAIFGLAALWRFTPPPRALALAAAQPAQIHIHALKAMADITVTPGRVGAVNVDMMLMTGEFGPLDAKEVTLVLANPARGIEPIRRKAERRDGLWRIDGLVMPAPGEWTVRLDILITDFEMTRLEGALPIRP